MGSIYVGIMDNLMTGILGKYNLITESSVVDKMNDRFNRGIISFNGTYGKRESYSLYGYKSKEIGIKYNLTRDYANRNGMFFSGSMTEKLNGKEKIGITSFPRVNVEWFNAMEPSKFYEKYPELSKPPGK